MAEKRFINSCELPTLVSDEEREVFRDMHRIFCAQKDDPDHECKGAVTLTHNSITLRCALCGDARRMIDRG